MESKGREGGDNGNIQKECWIVSWGSERRAATEEGK